jgi:FkbM family methyltransferase
MVRSVEFASKILDGEHAVGRDRIGCAVNELMQEMSKTGDVFTADVALQEPSGFWRAPSRVKLHIAASKFRRLIPSLPGVIQLPFGSWWLSHGSALDECLLREIFEPAETAFLRKYLRSGMTVLDIGAHHGYYTLLASRAVGSNGRIIAFEPSPKERIRLGEHLRLNNCENVHVEPYALEATKEKRDLYLVEGAEDYCNSLCPPVVNARTTTITVETTTLDSFLSTQPINEIDFIKMDVEGAELSVLKGAEELLAKSPRPVWLVELFDMRAAPWGYAAREVVQLLAKRGYRWYGIREDGTLTSVEANRDVYDANLVAVPPEREQEVRTRVKAERA